MSIENRFQNEGKEASLVLQKKHDGELRKVVKLHTLEIRELQSNFAEILEEEKEKTEQRYSDLTIQYETLQAAFVSFKESIIQEMNARWSEKEAELRENHENEMRKELTLQKYSIQNNCDEEKQSIIGDYEEHIAAILDKHREEMEEAAKQYSFIMETIAELNKARQEIKDLKDQLEQKSEELKNQTQYLSFLESQLASTRAILAEIEGTYKTNIGALKKEYVVSIKALEDQNLDLKQLFAVKAEELCTLKAAIEERERLDELERKAGFSKNMAQSLK
ncbi:synaptonemal complex central element protein 1-like [Carcharodon carcharias]|uniref:synaptonemal complex central element protein 1-like n=1 Tax=Carcharodon carcharias TaxID=13397 RepID=UPI001B7E6AB7|nr:synaptonemal complex central element protein 1-like [Carcharodon carcharias]